MTYRESLLGKLLNDESFFRWLKGKGTSKENEDWNRWLLEDTRHQRIVRKARKILTMPFITIENVLDKLEEFQRLQEKISESNSSSEVTKPED